MPNYKLLSTREMKSKGYELAPTRHPGEPSKCNRCGAPIEWWITQNHKSVPYDPCDRDDQERTCHFATCPNSNFKQPSETRAATGAYPAAQIPAMQAIQQQIVDEYRKECDGDAGYKAPEHKVNWLYKKLAEARLALATTRRA